MQQTFVHFYYYCYLASTSLSFIASSASRWPCDDEEPDCEYRVRSGHCYGLYQNESYMKAPIKQRAMLGLRTLSVCRKSCREHYLQNLQDFDESVLAFIELCGGVEDKVVDTFGYEHDICDESQAFVGNRRINYLASITNTKMTLRKIRSTQKQYTEKGIKRSKVPKRLFGDILDYYKQRKKSKSGAWKREMSNIDQTPCVKVVDDGAECSIQEVDMIMHMKLSEEMMSQIHKTLHKEAEEWSGVQLKPPIVFGIRKYRRGSWFADHVDRNDTHVISAIINVAQKVDEPWPLDIYDYQGVHHKVIMEPGDLLWYESANLPHGRIQPLRGKYFDNIFVHYKPVELSDKIESKPDDDMSHFFVPINT